MSPEQQCRTFLSYSRTDEVFALELAENLRSAGFNIWVDQLDIPAGTRWDLEVEKALDGSEIFMVLLTPESIASHNVRDEIGYAIDTGKHILPILYKNAKLPLRLRRFQYVDFTNKSFDEGLAVAKKLLQGLDEDLTIAKKQELDINPPAKIPVEKTTEDLDEQMPVEETTEVLDEQIPAIVSTKSEKPIQSPEPIANPDSLQFESVEPSPQKRNQRTYIISAVIVGVFLVLASISVTSIILGRNNPKPGDLDNETSLVENLPEEETNATAVVRVVEADVTKTPMPTAADRPTATTRSNLESGPKLLSRLEAAELVNNTDVKGFSQFARELYTSEELTKISENDGPIILRFVTPEPLMLGFSYCETSQELLEESDEIYEYIFKFNGSRIQNFFTNDYFYTSDDGLACKINYLIFDNWTSGKYTFYQAINIKKAYFEDETEIQPGIDPNSESEYIVEVP